MTRNPTKPERNVLGHVPESTRVAFARSSTVKKCAADTEGYKAITVEAVWNRLVESGLIEETVGFCRRTPEGDRVLFVDQPVTEAVAS